MEMLAKYTHVSKENTAADDGTYRFSLVTGNNSAAVRRVLETREHWFE